MQITAFRASGWTDPLASAAGVSFDTANLVDKNERIQYDHIICALKYNYAYKI